jgi:hypothetical protein
MDFDFQIFIHRPLVESAEPLPVFYATDANFGLDVTQKNNGIEIVFQAG